MSDQERILHEVLGPAVWARQAKLAAFLHQHYGGVVAGGPFQGLKLLEEHSWGIGDTSSKIVGLYEAELHPFLEELARRPPPAVINVGCAEGYYAVGLARLFPATQVFAFDTDVKAQVLCRRTAALNQVGDRVIVLGECAPAMLQNLLAQHPQALLVIDCEGYEKELIAGEVLGAAARASLIVECHDFVDATITATLAERLAASHRVQVIPEGPRDPNQLAPLQTMSSLDRWLGVLENRPAMMTWVAAMPRAADTP